MTPDAQRLAIVKAFPSIFRVWDGASFSLYYTTGDNVWQLTDVISDLNVIHEVEKIVVDKSRYLKVLKDVVYQAYQENLDDAAQGWYALATSQQRAEAILRYSNLWESS